MIWWTTTTTAVRFILGLVLVLNFSDISNFCNLLLK
jgi:hypothetical protein